jgi:hypothetical protein
VIALLLPYVGYLVVLVVGIFTGLVAGAFFARDELRAARALHDSSGSSATDATSVPASVPAPPHLEGR